MAISGVGETNTSINQFNNSITRAGGGLTEPATKGGNTSDPVDIVSLAGTVTNQQASAPAPNVEAPIEGGTSGGIGTPSSEGVGETEVGIEGKGGKVDLIV